MRDALQPRIPRALVFAVLAVLWVFPSVGAVIIVFGDKHGWRQANDIANALRAVTVEQWLAIVLIGIHGAFIWAACAGKGFAMLRRGISGRC